MGNLIGQSLGRYHILEQLGEGGMAVVYKAFDTRLERNVAIKVILPSREHSEKFLKRFEREAKALAQLSHPNIVKVIDYGEHEGLPYLVMEYLPGGTLKQKMTGQPLAWQEAARILIPLARALAYAHENKIVHRDIKPSNILITQSGEPMLSDFGIAKMLEAEETLDLTGTGVGVGTPEYMSPEQAQGQPVDGRSDMYSLGVVFYELVTGRKPYQADTPMAVIWKLASEPLPNPKQFEAHLPDAIEQILLKLLAKNPENRYGDLGGFITAIENLRQGENPRKWDFPTLSKRVRLTILGLSGSILLVLLIALSIPKLLLVLNKESSSPSPTPSTLTEQGKGQGESTPGTFATNAPQRSANLLFEENFDNVKFDGSFDSENWQCGTPACRPENISQSNGFLQLVDKDGRQGEAYGLQTRSLWNLGTLESVRSDLMISDFSGNGNAEMILQMDVINAGTNWYTSCNLGGGSGSFYYLCKARTNGRDDYITAMIPVSKAEPHQARIEIDQKESKISYYLDNTLIGSHTPTIAHQLDKLDVRVFVSIYSNGNSALIGQADNILVERSEQGVSKTALPASESLLYEENFETGFATGWANLGEGAWSLWSENESKVYGVRNQSADDQTLSFLENSKLWQDYAFETDVIFETGRLEQIWITARTTKGIDCTGYVFGGNRYGLALMRLDPRATCKSKTLAEVPNYPLVGGRLYKMRIEVLGSEIRAYIDDELVMSAEDQVYPRGGIAIAAYEVKWAYFDNIRVYRLGSPQ